MVENYYNCGKPRRTFENQTILLRDIREQLGKIIELLKQNKKTREK